MPLAHILVIEDDDDVARLEQTVLERAGYDVRVTASGGAKTLDDLRSLVAGTPSNVDSAIVGSALYEETLDLAEAIAALSGVAR